MQTYTDKIVRKIVSYYNINIQDATAMVEEEWEYIEEGYFKEIAPHDIAKNLISIYMAA